jgi:hypothetical protein
MATKYETYTEIWCRRCARQWLLTERERKATVCNCGRPLKDATYFPLLRALKYRARHPVYDDVKPPVAAEEPGQCNAAPLLQESPSDSGDNV